MSAQFENGFGSYTRFASTAAHANRLAMEHAENAFGLQLKTLGQNVSATTDFLGEFAQAGSLVSYQTLWPKGLQLARDNLERLASASQEVVGLGLKASEAIGQLARHQFEAASDRSGASAKAGKGRGR